MIVNKSYQIVYKSYKNLAKVTNNDNSIVKNYQ